MRLFWVLCFHAVWPSLFAETTATTTVARQRRRLRHGNRGYRQNIFRSRHNGSNKRRSEVIDDHDHYLDHPLYNASDASSDYSRPPPTLKQARPTKSSSSRKGKGKGKYSGKSGQDTNYVQCTGKSCSSLGKSRSKSKTTSRKKSKTKPSKISGKSQTPKQKSAEAAPASDSKKYTQTTIEDDGLTDTPSPSSTTIGQRTPAPSTIPVDLDETVPPTFMMDEAQPASTMMSDQEVDGFLKVNLMDPFVVLFDAPNFTNVTTKEDYALVASQIFLHLNDFLQDTWPMMEGTNTYSYAQNSLQLVGLANYEEPRYEVNKAYAYFWDRDPIPTPLELRQAIDQAFVGDSLQVALDRFAESLPPESPFVGTMDITIVDSDLAFEILPTSETVMLILQEQLEIVGRSFRTEDNNDIDVLQSSSLSQQHQHQQQQQQQQQQETTPKGNGPKTAGTVVGVLGALVLVSLVAKIKMGSSRKKNRMKALLDTTNVVV